MGIQKLSNTESVEALTYDRVWMDSLKIMQGEITNDAQSPKYEVEVTYRMYALDSSGNMHFRNAPTSIKLTDFYAIAITNAGNGDMIYANGLGAVEAVIAKMIEDQQGINTQVV